MIGTWAYVYLLAIDLTVFQNKNLFNACSIKYYCLIYVNCSEEQKKYKEHSAKQTNLLRPALLYSFVTVPKKQ